MNERTLFDFLFREFPDPFMRARGNPSVASFDDSHDRGNNGKIAHIRRTEFANLLILMSRCYSAMINDAES
jgi:hypothetical protein